MRRVDPFGPPLTRPSVRWECSDDAAYVVVRALVGYRVRVTVRGTQRERGSLFRVYEGRALTLRRTVELARRTINNRAAQP
jgi:hypothetical protein